MSKEEREFWVQRKAEGMEVIGRKGSVQGQEMMEAGLKKVKKEEGIKCENLFEPP